jgi:DNA primase small subunit
MLPQGWRSLAKSILSSYYSYAELELPEDMELREFSIQPVDSDVYVRHLSLTTPEELRKFVLSNPPLHLYYSSAKYERPSETEMENKGWLGSDLLFDIDADHLCDGLRSFEFCAPFSRDCVKISYVEVDKDCMRKTARDAQLLSEILEEDLGLSPEVHFSGNRGFHVLVKCDYECATLTQRERKEIAEYVAGEGVKVIGSTKDPGWAGRLARGESGVKIDTQVTVDVRRLVRMVGSLNGKAGLPVVKVKDPVNFSPDFSMVKMRGRALFVPWITAEVAPLGFKLKLVKGDKMSLELPVALHLHLKMLGEIVAYSE